MNLAPADVPGPVRKTYFAAIGDVHGQFSHALRLLRTWEEQHAGCLLSFALQVGDLECHRDEADLSTMAAPAKRRRMGDFSNVLSGHLRIPCPVFFVGGNHECYGWLDEDEAGKDASSPGAEGLCPPPLVASLSGDAWSAGHQRPKQIAHNLFYLGRACFLTLRLGASGGLRFIAEDTFACSERGVFGRFREVAVGARDQASAMFSVDAPEACEQVEEEAVFNIAGLSGIFREESFYKRRPPVSEFGTTSNKSWIGFNCYDVGLLLAGEADADCTLNEFGRNGGPCGLASPPAFQQALRQSLELCLGRLLDGGSLLPERDLLRILLHINPDGVQGRI